MGRRITINREQYLKARELYGLQVNRKIAKRKEENRKRKQEQKEEQAPEVIEIPFKGFFYSFKGAHTLYLSEEEAREAGGLGVKRFNNARDAVAYALGIKGND